MVEKWSDFQIVQLDCTPAVLPQWSKYSLHLPCCISVQATCCPRELCCRGLQMLQQVINVPHARFHFFRYLRFNYIVNFTFKNIMGYYFLIRKIYLRCHQHPQNLSITIVIENHKMVWIERALQRSSSPISLPHFSKPCTTWPCILPVMGEPQLLWAAWSSVSLPPLQTITF